MDGITITDQNVTFPDFCLSSTKLIYSDKISNNQRGLLPCRPIFSHVITTCTDGRIKIVRKEAAEDGGRFSDCSSGECSSPS